MTNQLSIKQVNFNGDTLMAAMDETTQMVYVGIKWVCRGIGLSEDQGRAQTKKVQSDIVLNKGCVKFDTGVFDPNNETIAIMLNFLPLWLAKISITPKMRLDNPELVEKLIAYQIKAKDVLAAAFLPNSTDTTGAPMLSETGFQYLFREGVRRGGQIYSLKHELKALRTEIHLIRKELNPEAYSKPTSKSKPVKPTLTRFENMECLFNDMKDDYQSFTTSFSGYQTVKSRITYRMIEIGENKLHFQVSRYNTASMDIYNITKAEKTITDAQGTAQYKVCCEGSTEPIIFIAVPKRLNVASN